MMSDEEIEAMAAQLEMAARVEDAHIFLWRNGGVEEESHIVGNRLGYLRLASVLLRASIAPYRKNSADILELESEEILEDYSYFSFHWFERREDGWSQPDEDNSTEEYNDTLNLLVCALFCAVFAGIFLVGLSTVWRLIFG